MDYYFCEFLFDGSTSMLAPGGLGNAMIDGSLIAALKEEPLFLAGGVDTGSGGNY